MQPGIDERAAGSFWHLKLLRKSLSCHRNRTKLMFSPVTRRDTINRHVHESLRPASCS